MAAHTALPSPAQLQHRIGEQLQALSQVSEALMFRLLDLEERLGAVEQQLGSLSARDDQAASGLGVDTGEILALTEERLARLEDLLSGGRQPLGGGGSSPYGQDAGLAGAQGAIKAMASRSAVRDAAFDPFPEEEEQAFMDELIA
ncbi:MAG: hypothetical protein RLZZ374_962 [Cyanobacteriota bacterium]|jgi:hypothetical protein